MGTSNNNDIVIPGREASGVSDIYFIDGIDRWHLLGVIIIIYYFIRCCFYFVFFFLKNFS